MKTVQEILNPPDQQDDFTAWCRRDDAYQMYGAKRLSDGTYVGVIKLAYTFAICMGVTRESLLEKRYCFRELGDCLHEYSKLNRFEDEPGCWNASRPPAKEDDYAPIETAPQDGTVVRVANFTFGYCNWVRSAAAFEPGIWVELDGPRAGIPLVEVTHWKP
ncbi:hypothetical protein [Pseudomonas sp. P8_250]|uniref:hypothetical protein n=1 Tax=Pseudomonas sp. P8_250 TaxID=3043446 RepID=UPI002A35F085|nr:hypothetical protein [Pseudomonas sp. P8_250]MDX9668721.1 hypothetical protein [Pseudomonas sp. P8_250]